MNDFIISNLEKLKKKNITNKKIKLRILLNYSKRESFLLKPKTWCKIKFLTKNAILMVACDKEYDFKDYIENLSDFFEYINKRKR